MMQKAHLGGYYICHDAMGRHLLPKSAAVRYLSLLKIVAVMSLLGVNLCKQLALCFPSILPELYVSQCGEILSEGAFLFPFTSIFEILMNELHANALSFYVTKTVLVGPKWFWSDQIDLDLTIMIWSRPK